MKEVWDLFITFFRIGLFTFGGGYAMLPLIQKEVVESKKWATEQEVLDIYAIGQSTPGLIAVNTSTFLGYKRKGILGAAASTLGIVTPSLIIIMLIATGLSYLLDYAIVKHMLAGIRVAVVALVLNAVIRMWKSSVKDWIGIIIFAVTFIAVTLFNFSMILVVACAIVLGMAIYLRKVKEQNQ